MSACPTGAIVEPGVVDARRCLAWLVQAPGSIPVEFRQAVGDRLYGCDDCQEVCPIGHGERSEAGHESPSGADVPAIWVLEASDSDLLDRFGRWYIADRDPRYLRRNALVVLGNATDEDPLVDALLQRFAGSPDPMLGEHAAWALARRATGKLVAP
jgi:epoxyqueuosine reductase|tara:strand:- start:40 stop:507 length:468 start_codon:yes stop_codon:yes gene_type:complete